MCVVAVPSASCVGLLKETFRFIETSFIYFLKDFHPQERCFYVSCMFGRKRVVPT